MLVITQKPKDLRYSKFAICLLAEDGSDRNAIKTSHCVCYLPGPAHTRLGPLLATWQSGD